MLLFLRRALCAQRQSQIIAQSLQQQRIEPFVERGLLRRRGEMNHDERQQLLEGILAWGEASITHFLERSGGERYYLLVLDCHLEEGQIGLCFNSTERLEKDIAEYGDYPDDATLFDLTYNPGNFHHLMVEVLNLNELLDYDRLRQEAITAGELVEQEFLEEIRLLLYEALHHLSEMEAFAEIPKEEPFTFYPLIAGEEVADELERFTHYLEGY